MLTPLCVGYGQTVPAVGLFLRFDAKPSQVFVKAMEGELKTILLPAHLRLRWIMANENSGAEIWLGKLVLRFHGTCAAIPATAISGARVQSGERISLADTAAEGAAILPYTELNCDRLRAFLSLAQPEPPGEETRLGIATGRVLAHELYHVLLQTHEHSATGIAEAVETPAALLGRSLLFEHGELERILARYKINSN